MSSLFMCSDGITKKKDHDKYFGVIVMVKVTWWNACVEWVYLGSFHLEKIYLIKHNSFCQWIQGVGGVSFSCFCVYNLISWCCLIKSRVNALHIKRDCLSSQVVLSEVWTCNWISSLLQWISITLRSSYHGCSPNLKADHIGWDDWLKLKKYPDCILAILVKIN